MKNVTFYAKYLFLYFALVLAVEFTGFLNPYLWVYFGGLASFFAATPVLIMCKKREKFGDLFMFSFFWVVIMFALGEYTKIIVPIYIIAMSLIGEFARKSIGYDTQKGARIGYAFISAGLSGTILPLYFYKEWYYAGAVEEMGSVSYAETLMKLSGIPVLISVIAAGFIFGYLGAVVSEKIFKDKVRVDK